jgi:putrescine transport system ATP-binding protein
MDGTVLVDEADHVIIDTPDCKHYVGHGITGTQGMQVTVALRPEKIVLLREKPDDEYNCVAGKVEEMSYFGSETAYRIKLASGMQLCATVANTERQRENAPTWGDVVWAHWSPQAHVVLTQ